MAVVSTSNFVSPGVSNTLRSLGKSVFNSSIGTIASASTMNKIYQTIDKLTSSVDMVTNEEAVSGRLNAPSLKSVFQSMTLQHSIEFMNENRKFMIRLMNLNANEHDITLDATGIDATGDSAKVKNEYLKEYEYADGSNYYKNYVNTVRTNQNVGDETTLLQTQSETQNYSGLHNEIYESTVNLYPDEENTGTFSNKWITENQESLLFKTKKLFNDKKINTIISAFHTNPLLPQWSLDNAKSRYGLSHGRNLLTRDAEYNSKSYSHNGYDNPYCRVWTHHHQYDRYCKTIRPFGQVKENGDCDNTAEDLKGFHTWRGVTDKEGNTTGGFQPKNDKWGWKWNNNGWEYSVLNTKSGLVNITPKRGDGSTTKLHTKQCMFSIENLAWRGYSPYDFENALSWEQRGPLGGRIMWFPPYGINFNETTTANWQSNTFIGRGEDVYTYSNTVRSGVLNFMMVVDHPSIIDYSLWDENEQSVHDTDVLRFFAGCDNSLSPKPTNLTDEYTEGEKTQTQEKIVEKKEPSNESEKPTSNSIVFFAFFPNNYSGVYDGDRDNGYEGNPSERNTNVDPVLYLLMGKGAQKKDASTTQGNDLKLTKDDISNAGGGYEMSTAMGVDNSNAIKGCFGKYPNEKVKGKFHWWYKLTHGTSGNDDKNYQSTTLQTWYYRIDGVYKYPQSTNEEKIHTFNQYNTVKFSTNNQDNKCCNYNSKASSLDGNFGPDKDCIQKSSDNDGKYFYNGDTDIEIYSLAEVAFALYTKNEEESDDPLTTSNNIANKINANASLDKSRIIELKKRLKKGISKVEVNGYASKAGYDNCNERLAHNRGTTIYNWLKSEYGNDLPSTSVTTASGGNNLGTTNTVNITSNANDPVDKSWRSVRVKLTFNTEETTTLADSESDSGKTKTESVAYAVTNEPPYSYAGHEYTVYMKDGYKWIDANEFNSDTNGSHTSKWVSINYIISTGQQVEGENNAVEKKDETNVYRYDQEYYFFKVLEKKDPLVFNSLIEKLRYFDPAFHSMTPEGFSARLTFLQQCMRQGNTVSASDQSGTTKSATNLAFGRAPYCVLRLGDFYNQMIVINNISINYDPLVWDLNEEGAGVIPLIANISISFNFVGGSDMSGPIRRLQNAMTYNYYANTRLYDNRADRVERYWSDKTCGALEHDEILTENKYGSENDVEKTLSSNFNEVYNKSNKPVSAFYNAKMYKG